MKHAAFVVVVIAFIALAACQPSHVGTFIDPSGSAPLVIKADGTIKNAMGDTMTYKSEVTDQGTVLHVVDDRGEKMVWTITKDGKELHGASSPAKVVWRRK